MFHDYTARSGAECKLEHVKHIALLWSAAVKGVSGYKHGAPLEHFAGPINHQLPCGLLAHFPELEQARNKEQRRDGARHKA